jgi:NMD protein affecting ribosome stability and mRNA decay
MSNDYLRLIFLQLERCNAATQDKLYEATLTLRSLSQPFSDDEFEKVIDNIQEELESELNWDEDGTETNCYYKAGLRIRDVCIDLLKRKGKIEG